MKLNAVRLSGWFAIACALVLLWHSHTAVKEPGATTPASATIIPNPRPKTNPAELIDRIRHALASTNSADHTAVISHLLAALVRADPQAAARFAEMNEIADTRAIILHRVAQLWAERDAKAALEWATSLAAPDERDAMVTDVCLQLSEVDPAEAVQTLSEHALGENPHCGLEALAQRWAGKDFPAARDWVLSRPDGWRRDCLIARLAHIQAQDSPQDAATFVVNEITEGVTQTEAVMAVLHQWAIRDPAAAAEWVGLFPEGGLKTRAAKELNGIRQTQTAIKLPGMLE